MGEVKQNVTMLAKDTLSAALAECFVTIGTKRYNFMQAINVEAKFEKTKTEVPILGKTGKGNKFSMPESFQDLEGFLTT